LALAAAASAAVPSGRSLWLAALAPAAPGRSVPRALPKIKRLRAVEHLIIAHAGRR